MLQLAAPQILMCALDDLLNACELFFTDTLYMQVKTWWVYHKNLSGCRRFYNGFDILDLIYPSQYFLPIDLATIKDVDMLTQEDKDARFIGLARFYLLNLAGKKNSIFFISTLASDGQILHHLPIQVFHRIFTRLILNH